MTHPLFDTQPPKRKSLPASPEAGSGFVDDLGSFGWLRNERDHAVMLEIRYANGNITAFSYPLLDSATFNPSTGVELHFSGTTVILLGSNLNTEATSGVRLFEALIRHRVLWVREADETMKHESDETDVVIDEVQVNSSQGNEK